MKEPCESGGIGRRTRLRIWRVKPWGFESPLSHQITADLDESIASNVKADSQAIESCKCRNTIDPAA